MRTNSALCKKQLGISLGLTVLGLACFLVMVWRYQSNSVAGLDKAAIEGMALLRSDWLTCMFQMITFFGSVTFIVLIDLTITMWGLWKKCNRSELLLLNLTNISGVILMQILKVIFGRERPPQPWLTTATGFSFPSGHSLMTALFYGFLVFMIVRNGKAWPGRKWLIAVLVCLPVLVGLSRVYLGVHYASDVLAGWSMGIAWIGVWMVISQLSVDSKTGRK